MSGFIGIGVFVVFRSFICWILLISQVFAANPYKLGEIDYFQKKIDKKIETEPVIDFREATISNDGRLNYYTPPPAMLTLLENPTKENARAYLNWQKQRLDRIMKAQETIDQVIKESKNENFNTFDMPKFAATR